MSAGIKKQIKYFPSNNIIFLNNFGIFLILSFYVDKSMYDLTFNRR